MKLSGKAIPSMIVLGVILFFAARAYWTPERRIRAAAVDRRAVALRVLAEYLAGSEPGSQVLVVANPFALRSDQPGEVYAFEKAALNGLKAGASGKLTVLGAVHPELTTSAANDPSSVLFPPDITTPLSFMTTGRAWDELHRAHPGVEVWVSLIGLPANVTRMNVWRKAEPRFALLLPDLRLVGGPGAVKEAFRSGKLLAVVLNRPGAPPESVEPDGDHRVEFDRRFLLLTATNVENLLAQFPSLL